MKKNILKKKDKRLYLENKISIQKKGLEIDNIKFFTYDYDFQSIINLPIKDFKLEDLKSWKDEEPEYYEFQSTKKIHENIKFVDFLYGDWWRIYDIKKDKLYYLTISTPYLRQTSSIEGLELEIIRLINSHYHKIYGYGKGFYDRFFQNEQYLSKMALCFECQILDSLPVESTDCIVDFIITEQRIIEIEQKDNF